MEYRLLAIGPTVLDVVAYTGGYLFDQSMAGWRVRAAVPATDDHLPLAILGVESTELEAALVEFASERSAGVVVVCANFHDHDHAVGAVVRAAVKEAQADVLLWDRETDADEFTSACAVRHRLSHAARAFKTLALSAATGAPRDAQMTESFRTAGPTRPHELVDRFLT